MYRAIIVDDEVHVCLLLEKLVDWNRLGIQITGIFTDSQDAYLAIQRKKPHIVVTDIKMPGMNGLELIKNCINEKLDVMFLLISGHAEFEYAHMAIAYGVENYLLKPINKNDLEENLISICNKLDLKYQQENSIAELKNKVNVSEEVLSKQFFKEFLGKPSILSGKSMSEFNNEYFLNLSDGYFQIFVIKPTCKVFFTNQQLSLLLKQMEEFCIKELKKYYDKVISVTTDLEAYFLVNGLKSQNSIGAHKLIFNDVSTAFFEYCDLTFALSHSVNHMKELSVDEASRALLQRYNGGINKYYDIGDLQTNYFVVDYKKDLNTLSGNINILNVDGIENYFQQIKKQYVSEHLTIENMCDMVKEIEDCFVDCMSKLEEKIDREELEEKFKFWIRKCDSKEELFGEIKKMIVDKVVEIKERINSDNNRVVGMAKEYINKHLAEKVVLEDIAKIVFMNPTYFSTLFKKETGENFSDYLVSTRIDKAKELLQEMDLSIQQVGEKVGYENARYFSKVFLKVVGVSPSDYRKYSKFL